MISDGRIRCMVTQTEFLLSYFILAVICGLIWLGVWFVKTHIMPEEAVYSQSESILDLNESSSDNAEDRANKNDTTVNAYDESIVVVNPVIIISGEPTSSNAISSFKSLRPDESQENSDDQQDDSDD